MQAEELAGLLNTGLKHMEKRSWVSIAQPFQSYSILPEILKKEKVKIDSGTEIEWNVQTDESGTAQQVAFFDSVNPTITDHQTKARVGWKTSRVHTAYDTREVAMNRRPSKIVDLLKSRRAEMDLSMANKLERQGWGVPASNDPLSINGIRYWIFTQAESSAGAYSGNHATAGSGDFLALNLSAHTAGPGNLSAVTTPRWGCWNHQYTDANEPDLLFKIRRAMNRTTFESPIEFPKLGGPMRRKMYTTEETQLALETMAKRQNDQAQPKGELAYTDGVTFVRRIPIIWVPIFDEEIFTSSQHPVFGIDWGVFGAAVLTDFDMMEKIIHSTTSPLSVLHVTYLVWNMRCLSRRNHFVLSKS